MAALYSYPYDLHQNPANRALIPSCQEYRLASRGRHGEPSLKTIDWQNMAAGVRPHCTNCFITGDLDGWLAATPELQSLLAHRAQCGGGARHRTQDGNLAGFI